MSLVIKPVFAPNLWEEFLGRHAPGALFQSWLWGEVQERARQKYWRFGLYDGAGLAGIFAVYKIRARRGTFLHVRHGPIFAVSKRAYWDIFFKYLRTLGRQEGAWFIRFNPLIENTPSARKFFRQYPLRPAAIHAMDAEDCWVLDLDKTEEELLLGMRKSTRYEIRRGQKLGLQLRKTADPRYLASFLQLYRQTSLRHGFVPHTAIREEFEVFAKENKALLIFANFSEQPLAAALILFYGPQAIYHHGASVVSKIPASYLVQWEAIREAQKRGMRIYNFWGIAIEDNPRHPWQGITLFKKGFGGRQLSYLHAYDLPLSPWYGLSRAIELWRKWRKGY